MVRVCGLWVVIVLEIFCKTACLSRAQERDDVLPLLEKAARVQQFNLLYPQEKVYLHFDNTGYFIGETIWIKAYVVRADTGKPTDLSGVLYVELLNAAGDVVERRKLEVEEGQARGDIRLDKLLPSGFYEVRAYTRYMTNWGTGACFSRVFPIFEKPERVGDYSKASIDRSVSRYRILDMRRQEKHEDASQTEGGVPVLVRPKGAYGVERHDLRLRLYPEGGSLVQGLEGRVAFCLTDKMGMPLSGIGWLDTGEDSSGPVFPVDSLGRGLFSYTPSESSVAFVFTDSKGQTYRFLLPMPEREGCVLRVNTLLGDRVDVEIASTSGLEGQVWGMTLQNGGTVVAAHSFLTGSAPHMFFFSRADMLSGVSRITIFDGNGRIWAERQVFIPPVPSGADSIRMRAETGLLTSCGKVRLSVKASPNATFFFSARDVAFSTGGLEGDVRTWMLLCSELRGYVLHPEYYFESDDAAHRKAADMLMLTQGWRRYDWRVMSGMEPFELSQPVENQLYLDGQVFPERRRQKVGGLKLNAYLYNQVGESLTGETLTDSAGRYVFSLPDCSGRWSLFLKAKGKKDKDDYRIGIHRSYSPVPRAYSWEEMSPIPESHGGQLKFSGFEDVDTLAPLREKKNILLPAVHVDERWVYENPRVVWERESVGRRKSFLYYDCDAAMDAISDKGGVMPAFEDWLKERNGYFSGDTYVMRDETSEEDWVEELKLANSGRNPDYADEDNPGKNEDFEVLAKSMKIGSVVIDKEYNIYKDGLTYDRRPIVWIIDNAYHSITGANYSFPSNPNWDYEHKELSARPMMEVVWCNSHAHETVEMPLFLDEVKSVYVAEDQTTWRDFIRFRNENMQMPVTVFVYTHHSFFGHVNGLRRTYFQGYNVPSTFEMNDYSVLPPMEDFRRTLYWNPDVRTDENGEAIIEFYNNSSCREIRVSAEGIAPDGRCIINE